MKCFYHPESDAVGICKNCNKGLCVQCAVDVGNGIACKGRCEERVKAIAAFANRGFIIGKVSEKSDSITSLIFIVLGILFLGTALAGNFNPTIQALQIVTGLFLLGIGLYFYLLSQKVTHKRQ